MRLNGTRAFRRVLFMGGHSTRLEAFTLRGVFRLGNGLMLLGPVAPRNGSSHKTSISHTDNPEPLAAE